MRGRAICLALCALATTALPALANGDGGVWDAMGRFHPVLVHFPVALIVCAAVAEALYVARREPAFGEAARVMIGFAAWVAVPVAVTGFAIASGEVFEGAEQAAFAVHRIAGITTPVLAVLAAGMRESSRRSGQIWELFLYRVFLALAVVSVGIAGHRGGQLVFGVDFFSL